MVRTTRGRKPKMKLVRSSAKVIMPKNDIGSGIAGSLVKLLGKLKAHKGGEITQLGDLLPHGLIFILSKKLPTNKGGVMLPAPFVKRVMNRKEKIIPIATKMMSLYKTGKEGGKIDFKKLIAKAKKIAIHVKPIVAEISENYNKSKGGGYRFANARQTIPVAYSSLSATDRGGLTVEEGEQLLKNFNDMKNDLDYVDDGIVNAMENPVLGQDRLVESRYKAEDLYDKLMKNRDIIVEDVENEKAKRSIRKTAKQSKDISKEFFGTLKKIKEGKRAQPDGLKKWQDFVKKNRKMSAPYKTEMARLRKKWASMKK